MRGVSNPQRIATNPVLKAHKISYIIDDQFQTLKGSLQTLIPTSYWKNLTECFKPSKDRYKRQRFRGIPQEPGSFKPSKDRYKPLKSSTMSTYIQKVSNPQRIATNPVPLFCSLHRKQTLFQTLKGSLQTKPLRIRICLESLVSNPQRIATNWKELRQSTLSSVSFKPSKDRYKPIFSKMGSICYQLFQTLKGSLQTRVNVRN